MADDDQIKGAPGFDVRTAVNVGLGFLMGAAFSELVINHQRGARKKRVR